MADKLLLPFLAHDREARCAGESCQTEEQEPARKGAGKLHKSAEHNRQEKAADSTGGARQSGHDTDFPGKSLGE